MVSKLLPAIATFILLTSTIFAQSGREADQGPSNKGPAKYGLNDFSLFGIKAGDDFSAVIQNPSVSCGEFRDTFFQKKVPPFVVPENPLDAARRWQGGRLGFERFSSSGFHGDTNLIINTIQVAYPDKSTAPKLLGAPVATLRVEGRVDTSDNRLKVVALSCEIANVDASAFQEALRQQFGFQGDSMKDEQENRLTAQALSVLTYDFLKGPSPGVRIAFSAEGLQEKYDEAIEDFFAAFQAEQERKSKEGLLKPSGILQ